MYDGFGWCPDFGLIAAVTIVVCIASGAFVGALGTLAWQELKHRREDNAR